MTQIDIKLFGEYEEGLTSDEIKEYLKARAEEIGKSYDIKQLVNKFNKIAGCNTCAVKLINGKLKPLMYRWDVERFARVLFEKETTYFD